MTKPAPEYLTTRELADLIRLKERKVYDLVATSAIPCVRVTGKLLFPRALIEAWLAQHAEYGGGVETLQPRPKICAGSHDPLLDWALVLIEWARRQQGLIVAPGNPLKLKRIAQLKGRRVIGRQREAGAFVLLQRLLTEAGLGLADLKLADAPALTEGDVATAVAEGRADAGLGIATVAHQTRLEFLPLIEERYDLVVWRASYFDDAMQKLLAFARTTRFAERARSLTGYDVTGLGTVHYNAP
jgi:excisionase family DNA binding protein